MTVVIVAKTFEDMTVLADTRVSYENNKYVPDKGIFKLITLNVGNPPATIVFGFSGYLDPICKILTNLINEKIHNYKRRFVLRTFAAEVRTWVEKFYLTMSYKDQENFKKSEILLCGYEIYRQPHPQRNDPKLAWVIAATPPPSFVYSYSVRGNGISLNRHNFTYIMGSGKREHQLLEQFMAEYFRREFYQWGIGNPSPAYAADRASKPLFFALQILSFFQHKNIISVGAPFQLLRLIPRQDVQQSFFWDGLTRLDSSVPNGSNLELINDNSGQKHTLITLPDWVNRNGAAGLLG